MLSLTSSHFVIAKILIERKCTHQCIFLFKFLYALKYDEFKMTLKPYHDVLFNIYYWID